MDRLQLAECRTIKFQKISLYLDKHNIKQNYIIVE